MKHNRSDWKAKNYAKEYGPKVTKKSRHEVQKEQSASNFEKTLSLANRCQEELKEIVRSCREVFTLRNGLDVRRDAIATISSRVKSIRLLLDKIERICEKEHLQRL